MAHEIATTAGRPAIAYFGETPWHGLGTKLEEPATAADAIRAAGLDYRVLLTPLTTSDGSPVPQRQAVVRSDTRQVLGVVGNRYVPIQNAECFDFLDAVVAEGQVKYHTAGALGVGERIWLLAKLPGEIRIQNTDDITEKYLLLSNSHNGTSALRVFFTPIRVVCANTLAVADRGGQGEGIAVAHKGDLTAKVQEAQQVLGLAHRFYENVQEKADLLARCYPTTDQLQNFFKDVYPDPPDRNPTRAQNVRDELTRLYEEGRGQDMPGVRHTMWAAVNAVTEYVDHYSPTRARTTRERADRRLQSQWFGSGARLKSLAWDLAVDMALAG